MGWLEKLLLFFLCLPLSSSLCSASTTETPIAPASNKENQRLFQAASLASMTSVQPIPSGRRPHIKASVSPRPLTTAALSFNSQQFDQQLQRYLRFLAQAGQPDILIVGSSRALQGIDPIVLQQTLSGRGHPKLKIFNFGINGATAQLVDLLLRQILTPDQLPRLIVWGDGVRAFNSGRIDITYNRAIASQGYQLLEFGIRPTLLTESLPIVQSCAAFSLNLVADKSIHQPKSFTIAPSLEPPSKRPHLCWEALKLLLAPESGARLEALTLAKRQEAVGFQAASEQFNPKQYFQRYPQVQGQYDADYRNFTLDGKQTEAFANVVKFAKTHQIPLVFVNLPLTQTYLDEMRTVNEQQFRAYLQRFARSQALSVYDFSQRWPHQNDYFTDPSHLNRYGAAAVATELGKSLLVPKVRP
ncbi:hypothetical protein [Stenomitos frigidus]|uniref:DUF1574 domain-containing protein n=1 Tax=Stenomitos frigidus ULC18 TaxID=2107698 RepID=A0A2T1E2F1_9CYAN|nr:hypothetical protein [Stenomitos frigidus]PSB26794.1 hypothetical protein C7B82_18210 [Stenomitos frigidus ULC18]